jgi:hypothetical protein
MPHDAHPAPSDSALREAAEDMLFVGRMMANLCFNVRQWNEGKPITKDILNSMSELYRLWDEKSGAFRLALSTPPPDA